MFAMLFSSFSLPVIVTLYLITVTTYCFVIRPLYFSPLSKILNAHWSSPISSIWITFIRYRRVENRTLHALHHKYGPILRLGPNELSINTIDNGVKTIYGGNFEKGHWYTVFDSYGTACAFSMLGSKEHSAMKKTFAHTYSARELASSETLAKQSRKLIYGRILPHIHALTAGTTIYGPPGYIEVLSLFYASSMDALTAYQFGLKNSSNLIEDLECRRWFVEGYQSRKPYLFYAQEIPRIAAWAKFLGGPLVLVPSWVGKYSNELEIWAKGMSNAAKLDISKREAQLGESGGGSVSKVEDEPVVLAGMMRGIKKEGKKERSAIKERIGEIQEKMVDSEMLDHIAAGHETSGITLTYMAYHLSRDPALQDALRKELRTLSPQILYPKKGEGEMEQADKLPDQKQIDSLPLLHAVMMETLRLNSAVTGPEPRVTPFPSCQLVGYEIPGGVKVSSSTWALHRNADVFPDPEKWDYTRWLDDAEGKETDERRKLMEKWFWAFSSGGRMCPGNHFAIMRE